MLPVNATDFTPWASLAGGVMIGLSAVLVMLFFGRIAGIAGISSGALSVLSPLGAAVPDWSWRVAFVAGLVAAPVLVGAFFSPVVQSVPNNMPGMALAGLLVGMGTVLGSGCTSGHGVCGLARLSRRSVVAVLIFTGAAAATVFVLRHVAA